MATANIDFINGTILKKDIYKNNVLLLKKGAVLNNYLLDKLNNFGFNPEEIDGYVDKDGTCYTVRTKPDRSSPLKILILMNDDFKAFKTREILIHAGFSLNETAIVKDLYSQNIKNKNISFIFIESKFYNGDFINDVSLLNNKGKIVIFVLGCDEYMPETIPFNTDYLNVKFLHRPLASSYIKALLQLYS